MKSKLLFLGLILLSVFCGKAYPYVSFQLSPGVDFYDGSIGYNAYLNVNFPIKLFNPADPDVNMGIKFMADYAIFNDVSNDITNNISILSYGAGIDLGYIVTIGQLHITPSVCVGYMLGNISDKNTSVADFNNVIAYPHLNLDFYFTRNFSLGLDFGYKYSSLKKNFDNIPDTIKNLSLNATLTFAIPDDNKGTAARPSNNIKTANNTDSNIKTNNNITNNSIKAAGGDLNADKPVKISAEQVISSVKKLVSSGDKPGAVKLLESYIKDNPADKKIKEVLVMLKSPNMSIVE